MEKNKNTDYTKCYIAFLDILGFKSLIGKSSCQDILDIFEENIKNPLKKVYIGDEHNKAKEIISARCIQTKVMSDSVCFYIDATLPDALFCLIQCCAIFQSKLMRREKPILIRGSIVLGDIYAQGDITFGSGLTQAYLLEEKSAKYPRIIITEDTLASANANISSEQIKKLLYSSVTCDNDYFYTVNSLLFFLELEPKDENDTKENRWKLLKQYLNLTLAREMDLSVREKYVYLFQKMLEFEKRENHA